VRALNEDATLVKLDGEWTKFTNGFKLKEMLWHFGLPEAGGCRQRLVMNEDGFFRGHSWLRGL
jgi:hypothetical protein